MDYRLIDLSIHFRRFGICDQAILWLLDLFSVWQEIDDIADEGKCDHVSLVTKTFVSMGQNPWYQANSHLVAPIVATQVLKWLAANHLEEKKEHLEKAYMLRAGYYDVVMYVASIHGSSIPPEDIYKIYGEKMEDYLKEMEAENA